MCASLTIVQDNRVEKDEVFSITVKSPDFALNVVGGPVRVVIQDDDSEFSRAFFVNQSENSSL